MNSSYVYFPQKSVESEINIKAAQMCLVQDNKKGCQISGILYMSEMQISLSLLCLTISVKKLLFSCDPHRIQSIFHQQQIYKIWGVL